MREWMVERRARTKQLIELGGLVVKAGLVDLMDDDRTTLYGAFLSIASKLQGDERDERDERDIALALWKRRGKRAFEAETEVRQREGQA
jgi:hypothetical protein